MNESAFDAWNSQSSTISADFDSGQSSGSLLMLLYQGAAFITLFSKIKKGQG
jgi:hypothetical protein